MQEKETHHDRLISSDTENIMKTYSENPKLSILTPTIPGRESQVQALSEKLCGQKGADEVEHLILSDNRKRSIGAKRQALVDIARGQYIAFVDDDDDVAPNYVPELLKAIKSGADVITFQQGSSYNGQKSTVVFKLGQGDKPYQPDGITLRDAWHVCAWNRDTVAGCLFGESNYGEDHVWATQARQRAKTTLHVDKVLHYYTHDAKTTAAPE